MSSGSITEDLQLLILKRLPVKTLLRCRCVCKSWKHLIASKSFIVDHLSVQTRRILIQTRNLRYLQIDPLTLPLFDTLESPINVPLPPLDSDPYWYNYTLSSVHGVNCVYNHRDTLLLFNPSTRQQLRIPPPEPSLFGIHYYLYLSDTLSGFWIDPCNGDFKVVIICFEAKTAVLFSSKEPAWMEISMGDMGDYESNHLSPQVMMDGVAYWIAYVHSEANEFETIVSFDFAPHEFGTIELPPNNPSGTDIYHLCRWKDLISVVHQYQSPHFGEDLWAMQNGSWSKMFKFDLHRDIFCVLFGLESSGWVLASDSEGCLLFHGPEDGYIDLSTELMTPFVYAFSYDFVESLVFPDQNCISM